LKDIRDNSNNAMARVAAVRLAELMKESLDSPGSALQQRHSLGLVVVIQNGDGTQQIIPPAPVPMIDVTPEREARESQERP
jgi:hypothetical protein